MPLPVSLLGLVGLVGLLLAATGCHGAVCPTDTTSIQLPWAPMPWRNSMQFCVCPPARFCRGPYCEASGGAKRHGFVASCASCACVPKCVDAANCHVVRGPFFCA